MASERKVDVFSLFVLILSIIALVMELIGPFASYYSGSYTYNSYFYGGWGATLGDLIAQIIILVLLILLIIIAINDLLPNKFISKDMTKFGLYFSVLVLVFSLVGLISFGVSWAYYEWWPDIGFYGPLVAGLLNTILYFLKLKK